MIAAALIVGAAGGCSSDSSRAQVEASGSPWLVAVQGSATPSPSPTYPVPEVTDSPTPVETPTVVITTVTASPEPGTCYSRLYEGMYSYLSVETGTGSATVSWRDLGPEVVTEYLLAPVSQNLVSGSQPEPTWTTVAPDTACVTITATLTGLTSGGSYVIWLDAVASSSGREYMIGRSHGFAVP